MSSTLSEQFVWQEGREHPLENDLILQKICKYCPTTFYSVKKLRLVSKAWKRASEPQWKFLTLPVTILQDKNIQQQQQSTTPAGRKTPILLSQFLEQHKKSKTWNRNLELKNWRILNSHFAGPQEWNVADLDQCFWVAYGHNIRVLTLNNCTLPWSDNFFDSCFLIALPNLERLTFLDCNIARRERIVQRQAQQNAQEEMELEEPINANFGDGDHFQIQMGLLNINVPQFERQIRNGAVYFDMEFAGDLVEARRVNIGQQPLAFIRRVNAGNGNLPQELAPFQQPQNPRLVSLCIQNLECVGSSDGIAWTGLSRKFPNLEEFTVRNQTQNMDKLLETLNIGTVTRMLKKLDIIRAYDPVCASDYMEACVLKLAWPRFSLDKLTLDCGLLSDREDILKMLETQAPTLRELHLFRAPFSEPYSSFPCDVEMPNLTELRLWGNVSSNLDFLKLMPKLEVLAWNAFCYDEASHGSCIHKCFKEDDLNPIFAGNIVKNTNGIGTDVKLENMTTLEIELGPVSLECYNKLGAWMPNLKALKGTVVGDEQFTLIGKQWPEIQKLELLHGSSVSANGILDDLLMKNLYKNLRIFVWKYCPCPRTTADLEQEEVTAENELRWLAGKNVVTQWKRFRLTAGLDFLGDPCLQNLFEEAIMSGGDAVPKFLNALKTTKHTGPKTPALMLV